MDVCTGRLIQPITNDNTRTNIKGLLERLASFLTVAILVQFGVGIITQTYPGK